MVDGFSMRKWTILKTISCWLKTSADENGVHYLIGSSSHHLSRPPQSRASRMRLARSRGKFLSDPVAAGCGATNRFKFLNYDFANSQRTRGGPSHRPGLRPLKGEFGHETLDAVRFDRSGYACSFNADSRTGLWQNTWNGLRSL